MRTAIFAAALLAGTAAIAQDYGTTTPTEPETTIPAETTPDAQAGMSDTMPTQPPPADTTAPPPGTMAPPVDSTTAMTQPTTTTTTTALATPTTVAPDNSNPEEDARGIPVISDSATAPAGFNTGVGGPFVDASTRPEPQPATEAYPPCTAEVTDNCVQTYERGRSPE